MHFYCHFLGKKLVIDAIVLLLSDWRTPRLTNKLCNSDGFYTWSVMSQGKYICATSKLTFFNKRFVGISIILMVSSYVFCKLLKPFFFSFYDVSDTPEVTLQIIIIISQLLATIMLFTFFLFNIKCSIFNTKILFLRYLCDI